MGAEFQVRIQRRSAPANAAYRVRRQYEVLVNLAAVTKKDRYIAAAHLFEQPGFLDPLAERRDELQGLHANTHVPKMIGAGRMYDGTGDHRYCEIVEYFLAEVLSARD